MHVSRHGVRIALASAAALTAASCVTDPGPPANPQSVVDERVAIMKGFAGAIGATTNFTQGKASAAEARARLGKARAGIERVGDLFPRGTALGDRGVKNSRALSTIFNSRDDFDGKLDMLSEALAALDDVLAKNSKPGATKVLATARAACSACHNKYRAAED
jgi:cytochrome c556